MSTPPDAHTELQALIEGDLPPERFAALQERLRSDPAFFQEYLKAVRVHHLMETRDWPDAESEAPQDPVVVSHPRSWLHFGIVSASVAAVFTLCFFWIRPPVQEAPLVEVPEAHPDFRFAADALFDAEVPQGRAGQIQEGDVVALREGYVSIRLVSGAEAVIESPSSFAIEGPNRLRLDHGNATFRVPDSAIGFTVQMPWLEVEDLGTVFSTSVDDETNRVYVEQGSVDVRHPSLLETSKLLVEGETLTCLRNEQIEMEADSSFVHLRERTQTSVVFHDLLTYAPDQALQEREPLEGAWQVEEGDPWVREGKMDTDGQDTTIWGRFAEPLHGGAGVVLLYLKARAPENLFHSKGVAGVSFFDGEHECFFFGDQSNDSYSWSFIAYGDYLEPGMKEVPREDLRVQGGEASFTLRYHQATGLVEIFRGWGVVGAPLVETKTDPGMRFDRLRITNFGGGDFSFEEVQVTLLR